MIQNRKRVPVFRNDWAKTREQMYTTKDPFHQDYTRGQLAIFDYFRYSVHTVIWVRRRRKWGEPFNICKVGWKGDVRGWNKLGDPLAWYLEDDMDTCYLMNCVTVSLIYDSIRIDSPLLRRVIRRTRTVSNLDGMICPRKARCSGRASIASTVSNLSPLLETNLIL